VGKKARVESLIKKWKRPLRLQDWFVLARIVKEEDDHEIIGRAGQVDIRPSVFEAIIEINATTEENYIEATVYHELAHIKTREIFWQLRQVFLAMDCGEALVEILNACEESQVRHTEFLIGRMLCAPRILEEK